MQITVHVRGDAPTTRDIRPSPSPVANEVAQAAKELGVELEPMHPGVEDSSLAQFYTVEVPDTATAEKVIKRLRSCAAVEAAYLKPPDALP